MSLDDQSDEELVRQYKSGNFDAFDAIVRRYQDRIYRLASVWLYDEQSAADVTQEVLVRSYKGLSGFRFRATPFTWLYRTTRNVCHEFNRRRREDPMDEEPPDSADDAPDRLVAGDDAARRVRQLVSKLPDRQQEVVVLRVFEDLSVRETARAMGCREGTVKALMHKATQSLRRQANITGLIDE